MKRRFIKKKKRFRVETHQGSDLTPSPSVKPFHFQHSSMGMDYMAASKQQCNQVRHFLCVLFILTFCRTALSGNLNETFPTLLTGQKFEMNSSGTHDLKSADQSEPNLNLDSSSNDKISVYTHSAASPTTPPPQHDFPRDLFTIQERRKGWVFLHVFGMIYMFLSLVFVCDKFFVPAVEVSAEMFNLSDDVAGAIVMAPGRSLPKFLAIMIGLFLTHSNIKFGSVVGPAVYNFLFVPGICALFTRNVLSLSWWPVFRDVSFYLLGFILLIVFFLDDIITWGEGVVLVSVYALYVLFLTFNTKMERGMKTHIHKMGRRWRDITGISSDKEEGRACQGDSKSSDTDEADSDTREGSCEPTNNESQMKALEESVEGETPVTLKWPDTGRQRLIYLLLLPVLFPLWLTIPIVHNKKSRKFTILTLVACFVWIAVFIYLILWFGHQVGDTFGIPDPILTLLVAGTSNADLVTSVIVSRKGLGNMAVSSCGSSNILDITLSLPASWLLYSSIHGLAPVVVNSVGLICASTLLFLMLLLTIISFASCKWKMNKVLGCAMVLLYSVFVLISIMLQFHVIVCPVSTGE